MQAFFILMAVITGVMLIITLIFAAVAVDAELQRDEGRKADAVVCAMPAAKLTLSEYNRLIRGERARRHWRR